jgi:hypothetical protein
VAAVDESGRVGVDHSEKIRWDKVTDNTPSPSLPFPAAHGRRPAADLRTLFLPSALRPPLAFTAVLACVRKRNARPSHPARPKQCGKKRAAEGGSRRGFAVDPDARRKCPCLFRQKKKGWLQTGSVLLSFLFAVRDAGGTEVYQQ